MALSVDDFSFPTLFVHSVRKEWGVGVLAGEKDGKRRYLFENGEERTLASGFDQLMKRVERPTPEQQLALARLQGVLAGRAKNDGGGAKAFSLALSSQFVKFRERYPAGFSDPSWLEEVRGGASGPVRAALTAAEEHLSAKSLDALAKNRSPADAWQVVRDVVASSGFVPAAQLALTLTPSSGDRGLPLASCFMVRARTTSASIGSSRPSRRRSAPRPAGSSRPRSARSCTRSTTCASNR
jgi:hypothetical protein